MPPRCKILRVRERWLPGALLGLTAIAVPGAARAIDPAKPVGACTIEVWQARDGLPGNTVRAIRQTADGYLWVATLGGIGRYDGVEFTELDPPGVTVATLFDLQGIHAARDGSLWIAPSYREPLRFANGRAIDFARRARGLPRGTRTSAFAEDGAGVVWLSTTEGLYRYERGRFEPSQAIGEADLPLTALGFDAHGRLWVGRRQGLFRVERDRLIPYDGPHAPVTETVDAIHRDRGGRLWVAAGERLLEVGPAGADRAAPASSGSEAARSSGSGRPTGCPTTTSRRCSRIAREACGSGPARAGWLRSPIARCRPRACRRPSKARSSTP
jgi:ligand-binding sensor domain-containing protein